MKEKPAIVTPGPRTVQEARRAVEASRERISATLEELEERIVETRASIKRKVDVARPAREAIRTAPFVALGVAVAVGLFLGTRGGDDDEEDEYFEKSERKALEEWRQRRRRMLLDEGEDADDMFEELENEGKPSRMGGLFRMIGHELAGVAVGIVAAEIAERLYGAHGDDEESDDEADDDSAGDVISDDDVIFDEDDGA